MCSAIPFPSKNWIVQWRGSKRENTIRCFIFFSCFTKKQCQFTIAIMPRTLYWVETFFSSCSLPKQNKQHPTSHIHTENWNLILLLNYFDRILNCKCLLKVMKIQWRNLLPCETTPGCCMLSQRRLGLQNRKQHLAEKLNNNEICWGQTQA